jgi:hypothetical protein
MASVTHNSKAGTGKSESRSKSRSKWSLLALAFVVMLLFLAALQVAVVSVSLYFSSLQEASYEHPENSWLDFAELLSNSNPDVFYARAGFLRQKALLADFKDQRAALLRETLRHYSLAADVRPLWPYYKLSQLNTLVLMDASAITIQQKVAQIIQLAPNERGLDRQFLELAFYSWVKLSVQQQQWMLTRLSIVPRGTLQYVYSVAKNLNQAPIICTNLPSAKIKKLCKAN